jgi:hypothetical protein
MSRLGTIADLTSTGRISKVRGEFKCALCLLARPCGRGLQVEGDIVDMVWYDEVR